MPQDPYKILGVSPSASEDEITTAYRKLAKKYHPDLNPGNKDAEEKMREVNAAYERIKTMKNGGAQYERSDGSYGPQQRGSAGQTYRGDDPFGGFGFGGSFDDIFGDFFGGAWQQQQQQRRTYTYTQTDDSPMMRQARRYVEQEHYTDALRVLSQMNKRSPEWYFLSAISNAGTGNRITALNHAREAVRLDPQNIAYRQLLNQLQQGAYAYREAGQRSGFDMQNIGRTLLQFLMAQLCCLFCCRPC